jgi:hypothetical protein
MGEAQRRKAEIARLKQAEQEWFLSLTPTERTAADVARRAHTQLVERRGLVAACYLLAFFLNELLRSKHAIETDLVVGWANDGSWPGVTSHAWIELGGKKIDISTTKTDMPESHPPGDLLILDRVVRPGIARYAYYREPPPEALAHVEALARQWDLPDDAVDAKSREHEYVLGLSKTRQGILTYFSRNPPDRQFEALARAIA